MKTFIVLILLAALVVLAASVPGKKERTQEEREFFKQWAKKHQREYETLELEEEAMEKLLIRKMMIDEHNKLQESGQKKYRRGYNKHSDLTHEEKMKKLMGLKVPDSENFRSARASPNDPKFPPGPASVNWTAEGIVGPVEDQSWSSFKLSNTNFKTYS